MRFALATLLSVAIGQAAAASIAHNHAAFHRRAAQQSPAEPMEKRKLGHSHLKRLSELGFISPGDNPCEPNSQNVWIGSGGPYTNKFHNHASEDIILVVWGSAGSWVNAVKPIITLPMSAGEERTLSFANGVSGAWAALHPGSTLKDGQICDTWGEFTFSPEGVVDVSREVNMKGHHMRIEAPTCTTDMEKCVFLCAEGDSCMTNYLLHNCAAGSQPGAQYGQYFGADSGGCGGLGEASHVNTFFGHKNGF